MTATASRRLHQVLHWGFLAAAVLYFLAGWRWHYTAEADARFEHLSALAHQQSQSRADLFAVQSLGGQLPAGALTESLAESTAALDEMSEIVAAARLRRYVFWLWGSLLVIAALLVRPRVTVRPAHDPCSTSPGWPPAPAEDSR